ncbi:MAG: hypothetical protein IJX06_01855 [Clostridia bacterium]|nr:hypothetical protein [Clostridia bacterium]
MLNWLARNIAGLKNTSVRYQTCEIKPYLFDENCSASAYTTLPTGKIEVKWQKTGSRFSANIVIPEKVNARLVLLDKTYELKTGRNEIEIIID